MVFRGLGACSNVQMFKCSINESINEAFGFDRQTRPNLRDNFAFGACIRWCGGNDFLNARGEFHTQAASIGVNEFAHVREQFLPFDQPQGPGLSAVMTKRNNADDAINTAVSGIISICAIVDVVFWGYGGVSLGDIFHGFFMIVNDANAAVLVASIGFKYRNVMRIGFNGATLDENERMRLSSPVLCIDDAEAFVWHSVGFASGSSTF